VRRYEEENFMVEKAIIDCEVEGGLAILTPYGNIDEANFWTFQEMLRDLTGKGIARILVDLEKVDYLASSTLGVIASTAGDLFSRGGCFFFFNAGEGVRKILSMTRLDEKLKCYDTRIEAVAASENPTVVKGFILD